MIDVQNVRFTYDGANFALDGVSLHVRKGEFLCILGGNGSGKSTLAKHLNALLIPDEGTVKVQDMPTADADCTYRIRETVGMVFQNPDDQLVASLVEDDVAFGPENLGIPTDELRERVTQHGGAGSLMGDRRGRTQRLFSPQALFSKVSEWNPAGLPSWSPAYIGRPLSYCESGRSPFIRASSVPCSARGFPYRRPNPFSSG